MRFSALQVGGEAAIISIAALSRSGGDGWGALLREWEGATEGGRDAGRARIAKEMLS